MPPPWETRPEDFPLAGEILDRATGLIVHSRYVEDGARRLGYAGPLWRIPHPAWPAPAVEPAQIEGAPRRRLLRPPERVEADPAAARGVHAPARRARGSYWSGPVSPRFDLDGRLEKAGLLGHPAVLREEYVPEERLWALMAGCDVCVSLRAPTMGETSGTAMRALSLGKPLVVSDLGWFAELPDGVARKVPVGEGEVDALVAALLDPPPASHVPGGAPPRPRRRPLHRRARAGRRGRGRPRRRPGRGRPRRRRRGALGGGPRARSPAARGRAWRVAPRPRGRSR